MLKKKNSEKLKPSGASSVNAKNDDIMYRNVTTKYGIRYDSDENAEVNGNDDGRPAKIQSLPPTIIQRRNNADDELSRYVLHEISLKINLKA